MDLLNKEHYLVIFNDYTEKRNLENRINNYAKNLEHKVEERTREIQTTNRQLLEDLNGAKLIQRSLLTNNIRKIPGYTYTYKFYPSKFVGGDFFNINRIDKDHYYFYISDVSGHGVPAAMLTVFLQQSIRSIITNNNTLSPGFILTTLNKGFYKENFSHSPFITLFFCIIDLKTNTITYSVAGHHNGILFNRQKKTVQAFGYYSKPIGFVQDYSYREQDLALDKDDNVFLYTDGLTDIFNKKNKPVFSEEKLLAFLKQNLSMKEPEIIRKLMSTIRSLKQTKDFEDDIAILDIKRIT